MPVPPDAPLRKITLNLYESDCQDLERIYGHGWSANLRVLVHNLILYQKKRPTLGDLITNQIGKSPDDHE